MVPPWIIGVRDFIDDRSFIFSIFLVEQFRLPEPYVPQSVSEIRLSFSLKIFLFLTSRSNLFFVIDAIFLLESEIREFLQRNKQNFIKSQRKIFQFILLILSRLIKNCWIDYSTAKKITKNWPLVSIVRIRIDISIWWLTCVFLLLGEWKPIYRNTSTSKQRISIMQIAFNEEIFLVDLLNFFHACDDRSVQERLANRLFNDEQLTVLCQFLSFVVFIRFLSPNHLGYGFSSDMKMLISSFPIFHHALDLGTTLLDLAMVQTEVKRIFLLENSFHFLSH